MYIFIDKNNIDKTKKLLLEFEQKIFIKAFPDPDERESFTDDIIPRIKNISKNSPQTFCILRLDPDNIIIGGLVADWYHKCESLELIYLAVDESRRGEGIGKGILDHGLSAIRKNLSSIGKTVKHIFLEVDIPRLTADPTQESSMQEAMDSVLRLTTWEKWGAKRIPINYVQPSLSAGKAPVSNMMLMYLDDSEAEKDSIPAAELKDFLISFYQGLNASDSDSLYKMLEDIDISAENQQIRLDNITECAYAVISDATITTHFQITGKINLELAETCNDFNSFECDLMNYMNQEKRPFKTKFVKLYKDIPMIMPSFYCYTSEGITHYYTTCPDNKLKVNISVSVSCPAKPESIDHIAHISIKPSSGTFSDFDYIRLVTMFGSKQEGYKANSEILFHIDTEKLNFRQIIQTALHLDSVSQVVELKEGISQMDIKRIKPFNNALSFSTKDFFNSFTSGSSVTVNPFNKVICGLILGIFDHDRMNSAEVEDTIRPIVITNDSFIIISRGHIFKIEDMDEKDARSFQRIMISPYLLTPSTALAFNGLALKECETYIQEILDRRFNFFISNKIQKSETILDTKYMHNIFQYQSEQDIIKEAERQRSMNERYSQQCRRIDLLKKRTQKSSDIIVELILGVLAIFGLVEILAKGMDGRTLTIILLIVFLFISYELFRWYKVRKMIDLK